MTLYRLFFLTRENHIFGRHEISCHDDLSALERAFELAKEHAIEIWQEKRRVALVVRGGDALNADNRGSP